MPLWCSFHWNHKRMVYRIVEIYRISSLVTLLPMVKEPVCSIWPQWRGLFTPDFISGGEKKKFPSTCACTFCFVAQISLKFLSMSWVSTGCLPSILCLLNQLLQGLRSHTAHTHTSQGCWRPVAIFYLFIFFKRWDENRAPVCSWPKAFCVCLCICV